MKDWKKCTAFLLALVICLGLAACGVGSSEGEREDYYTPGVIEDTDYDFTDDNPAEREIVRQQAPGVTAPEIGKPEDYIRVLDRGGYFEVTSLSEDDRKEIERRFLEIAVKYANWGK